MTNLKSLMLGLSAAALTVGGVACAQAPAPAEKPRTEHPRRDVDGDGTITRAEAGAAAAQTFARLDVNKDGKLDRADRELGRRQMREAMFARLDTNGDGSISRAEFSADRGPGRRGGPDAPPPPGAAGQKSADAKVWAGGRPDKVRHGGWGRHGGPRGHMLVGKADTDGDGAVSQAEFTAAALRRFDAKDANRDGKVTKAERHAARETHREKRRAEWQARKTGNGAGGADKTPGN